MKNLLLLFLASLVFSVTSCKKKYTCDCKTTYTYENTNNGFTSIIIPGSKTAYSEKMKQKQAYEACKHEQTAIQTNFTNGITDNGRYTLVTGESIVTSCNIIL